MSHTKRCPKNKDNGKSRYDIATTLKQLVVNIIYFFNLAKRKNKKKNKKQKSHIGMRCVRKAIQF